MNHETPDDGASDGETPMSETSVRDGWTTLWARHSPVGQLILEDECLIRECNTTAAELLGCTCDDLVGRKLYDYAGQDSVRALEVHLQRTFESGQSQTCEVHLNRGEEYEFDAVLRSCCVFEDDEPKYCMVVFFDIQDWKGAEPSKLLFEEQLRQSQRLEVLGRLAAGVTHDFNNLLTLITGYSRLLTDQLRDDSRLRRHAEKISKAGSQATELVSQLLAFSRKSQLQSAVVNVNEVIVDFESMLEQIVGEHIELEAILDPDLANIRVNPSQFDQVLMNLATNARDAMPDGGKLRLETTDTYVSNPSEYGLTEDKKGRYVRLSVSDTGTGMSPEVLEHIFDPFYTTKDVGKGTGLGLATVFSVISQYGGAIDVETEPGEGTTFELLFPAADASVDRNDAPPGLAERSSGYETVLLVEDNEEVRRFAATVLEDYGYRVIEVSTAEGALDVASEPGRDISAVISDVLEPEDRNREFLESIGASQPAARVIQVCGYPTEDSADGVTEMLPKPYTPEQLASIVRKALDDD